MFFSQQKPGRSVKITPYLEGATEQFAGAAAGLLSQQGFTIASEYQLERGGHDASADNTSVLYRANAILSSTVLTGSWHDVVAASGGNVNLGYNRFSNEAQDLVIGFGRR